MQPRVRPAEARDVEALIAIRAQLTPRWRESVAGAAGGFLLGSTVDAYRAHVANGCVMVSEVAGIVNAYTVVLPDAVLRTTDVYAKRHDAGLAPGLLERLEGAKVAYFDQLAARPGHGAVATKLAFLHLIEACAAHDALLATTVIEPVVNRAAVPLLEAVGFRPVGTIEEHYPEVGAVTSRVYLVETSSVAATVATARGERFHRRAARSGGPVVPSSA